MKAEAKNRKRINHGHLEIYCDPDRPGGGFWRHACESEKQCGNYNRLMGQEKGNSDDDQPK